MSRADIAGLRRALAVVASFVVLLAPAAARATATITIINLDGAGVGLNDPTPVAPVGGNPGTTRGAQRFNAMQFAADTWGAFLDSSVTIRVGSSFAPLFCDAMSATLGQAGPNSVHRDFAGAPVAATWYAAALANSRAGVDLNPGVDDISATFNSAIGTTCALPLTFYYGFDGNPPPGGLDFVTIVLHELGHGCGFLTFVDLASGAKLGGFNDTFMRSLEDHSTGTLYPAMTNGQRVTASIDTGDLHWVGALVVAASGTLTGGVGGGGHVQMYAPNPAEPGSSVSHYDTAVAPDELLEPNYTGPNHDLSLTLALLRDTGWVMSAVTPTPTVTPSPTATPTASATVAPTPVCGATPDAGCRTPAISQKALLQLKDKMPDDKDVLVWKWSKGAITLKSEFGNPITTDTYELCIYDGGPSLIMHATAPAGGLCKLSNPKPCWSENAKGFKYNDKDLTPLGLQGILLKEGPVAGAAKIVLKGKGVNLDMPPTFPLAQPVTVQLKNSSGMCWEATYGPPALKNTVGPPGEFKDKAD